MQKPAPFYFEQLVCVSLTTLLTQTFRGQPVQNAKIKTTCSLPV